MIHRELTPLWKAINALRAGGITTTISNHDHSGDVGDGDTFDAANLTSGAAVDGYVLTADGSAGAAWEVLPFDAVTTKTGVYTAQATDRAIICNSATAFTVTLLGATGSGQRLTIKNINTGLVTVDGASSDTIDGSDNVKLAQWDAVQIVDYAANKWAVV
jgi:hypothetical protein